MIWRDAPIPIRPYPRPDQPEHDLTGMRVCRYTVMGLAKETRASWVVRCVCGKYATQKAKFLKSDAARTGAMCPGCDYLEELKAGRVKVKP